MTCQWNGPIPSRDILQCDHTSPDLPVSDTQNSPHLRHPPCIAETGYVRCMYQVAAGPCVPHYLIINPARYFFLTLQHHQEQCLPRHISLTPATWPVWSDYSTKQQPASQHADAQSHPGPRNRCHTHRGGRRTLRAARLRPRTESQTPGPSLRATRLAVREAGRRARTASQPSVGVSVVLVVHPDASGMLTRGTPGCPARAEDYTSL